MQNASILLKRRKHVPFLNLAAYYNPDMIYFHLVFFKLETCYEIPHKAIKLRMPHCSCNFLRAIAMAKLHGKHLRCNFPGNQCLTLKLCNIYIEISISTLDCRCLGSFYEPTNKKTNVYLPCFIFRFRLIIIINGGIWNFGGTILIASEVFLMQYFHCVIMDKVANVLIASQFCCATGSHTFQNQF